MISIDECRILISGGMVSFSSGEIVSVGTVSGLKSKVSGSHAVANAAAVPKVISLAPVEAAGMIVSIVAGIIFGVVTHHIVDVAIHVAIKVDLTAFFVFWKNC